MTEETTYKADDFRITDEGRAVYYITNIEYEIVIKELKDIQNRLKKLEKKDGK